MSIEEKKEALAKYLGVKVEDLRSYDFDKNMMTIDGEEYLVVDEDEAYKYAKDYIKGFIDDQGIDGFTEDFREWIIENAIDSDWFDDAKKESYEYYVDDIENEDSDGYENRLIEELHDNGFIDDDDLYENEDGIKVLKDDVDLDEKKEEYVDYFCNSFEDSIEWFRDNYGKDELKEVVVRNNLVDVDKVVDEAINWDGLGHFLASYDGEEIELDNDLFAYRVN